MGAKNVPLAQKYLKTIFVYAFVMYVILGSLILIFKENVCRLFTNQIEILQYVHEALPFMMLLFFLHGMAKTFEGATRGLGK